MRIEIVHVPITCPEAVKLTVVTVNCVAPITCGGLDWLSSTTAHDWMTRPTTLLRLVGYALFSIPPLLLLIYLVTQFPRPQESLHIYPSLASVPRSNRVWEIYNEDYFPGGGYAVLPYGQVSCVLVCPHHAFT